MPVRVTHDGPSSHALIRRAEGSIHRSSLNDAACPTSTPNSRSSCREKAIRENSATKNHGKMRLGRVKQKNLLVPVGSASELMVM